MALTEKQRLPETARALAIAVSVLVPVAAWPGVGDPFTTPRLAVLAIGTGAILSLLLLARAPLPEGGGRLAAAAAWLAVLGVSSAFAPLVSLGMLLQELLVIAWACALAWAAPSEARVAGALRLAAVVVAAWALLQWFGVDPWATGGWTPARTYGPRMRVYGPLGNPNYVGAFLAAVLPLVALPAIAAPRRWTAVAAAILVCAAVVATGSRGAWLGAAVGAAWLAASGAAPGRTAVAGLLLGLVVIGAGVALGPARSLGDTWRGRAYIWSVAAPHLLDHPLTGWGPGSFSATYPTWEVERLRRGVDRDVRAYAAAQRHAHNDYIERLAELGVPGLLAWCAIVAWVLVAGARAGRGPEAGIAAAAAGLAALAAVSLVDFPMQRPVERFTWWTLAVLATSPGIRSVLLKRT